MRVITKERRKYITLMFVSVICEGICFLGALGKFIVEYKKSKTVKHCTVLDD